MRLPYALLARHRRGLVVYQLVLMLLAIIVIIVALLYFARRQQPAAPAPADTTPSVGLLHHSRPGGPGESFMA
ncbi:MAG TPA: hypothetical protein VIQ60_01145 [Gemmatimonadaceae bacterium]